jgi:curved DNA-binding protein CbpA
MLEEKMSSDRHLYKLLEVDSKATTQQILRACSIKTQKIHPDKFEGEEKKNAQEKYDELNRARDLLIDKVKRKQYDNGEIDGKSNPTFIPSLGGEDVEFDQSKHAEETKREEKAYEKVLTREGKSIGAPLYVKNTSGIEFRLDIIERKSSTRDLLITNMSGFNIRDTLKEADVRRALPAAIFNSRGIKLEEARDFQAGTGPSTAYHFLKKLSADDLTEIARRFSGSHTLTSSGSSSVFSSSKLDTTSTSSSSSSSTPKSPRPGGGTSSS